MCYVYIHMCVNEGVNICVCAKERERERWERVRV